MPAVKGSQFCFTHNPTMRRAQAEARKLGGQKRHTPHFGDHSLLPEKVSSFDDLLALWTYNYQEVVGMENSIPRSKLLNAMIESGKGLLEVGEYEKRIRALEERINTK